MRAMIADPIAAALALHKSGRLDEAESAYLRILEGQPGDARALHLLGLLKVQAADYPAGISLIRQSVERGGPAPRRLVDLGTAHRLAGELEAAETAYREALSMAPGLAQAWSGLADVLRRRGKLAQAIKAIRESLRAVPDDPQARLQLASLLAASGDKRGAETAFREALAARPRSAMVALGLGDLLSFLDRMDEAREVYRQGLDSNPGDTDLLAALGENLLECDQLEEAESFLRRALEIRPGHVRAWFNLGKTLIRAGRMDAAFIETWLSFEGPVPPIVRQAAVDYLKGLPEVREIAQVLSGNEPDSLDPHSPAVVAITSHPVLRLLLRQGLIDDLGIERLLTAVRRSILLTKGELMSMLGFVCDLAEHCFQNEYVFFETNEETDAVRSLQEKLTAALESSGALPLAESVLFAAYRPLYLLGGAERLLETPDGNGEVSRVFSRQIREPMEERTLADAIPVISEIRDPVSRSVRAQYEENPYPRWKHLPKIETRSMEMDLTGLFPYLRNKEIDWPERPRVLVAGCGTGRQSVIAVLRFQGCTVKAVDLSLASLAFAARKTREAGLTGVEYVHGDILQLDGLEERFDLVECTGVLHHLADPLEGWRVLRRLVKPGGFMKIGLYSEQGRASIIAARQLASQQELGPTPEGIREARRRIGDLPEDHPARQVTQRPDFYAMSTCRDMIFHVQEHRMRLGQIAEWLESLSLEFVGFELTSRRIAAEYRSRFPDDPDLRDLACWEAFERDHPGTFAGMYVFWARDSSSDADHVC